MLAQKSKPRENYWMSKY